MIQLRIMILLTFIIEIFKTVKTEDINHLNKNLFRQTNSNHPHKKSGQGQNQHKDKNHFNFLIRMKSLCIKNSMRKRITLSRQPLLNTDN